MSEGLAKSSAQAETVQVQTQSAAEGITTEGGSPVHTGVYRFFNTTAEGSSNPDQLKKVNDWALNKGGIGKGLQSLKNLEIKLGVPKIGETRVSKLYTHILMSERISSLQLQEKLEVGQIHNKAKSEIDSLKLTLKEKRTKLDAEIKEAEKAYKLAAKRHRINVNNRSKFLKTQFAKQLVELKAMRNAYKGG